MSDSSVAKFIAYLKDNPDLRMQMKQLERSLGYAIRQEDESIAAIAAEAGFDVSKWNGRATVTEPARPAPQVQAAVCCGILTSDITLLV
jgi:hypothetical protein